ncbi:hypothetical protein PA598K_01344 [Paenibacillus sp. 598K]|uniref:phage gp6-like head-tail connector protein n=1 Tax=Paenibacillus sp. 598K TaxID=1117987 RepID=UPI000FFA4D8D|nr:phage gp6-like head-tail connector protein [Paenibacillus sp. 598K]GBF73059.1 hypothetical protein PA598K_01344 [Paenibacillus sp. 598K]
MLTTIERARRMGVDPSEAMPDEELTMLIAVASTAIEEYCRRKFGMAEHSDRASGMRGPYLQLPNYPIHSVVIGRDFEHPVEDVSILADGILFSRCGWPGGIRDYAVTYTAGYVLPSQETEDNVTTLPATLEYACVLMIKHLQREHGVASERVGDISVSYSAAEADMPSAVKAMLAPHVRPEI